MDANDDPQLALSRPLKLSVSPPAQTDDSSSSDDSDDSGVEQIGSPYGSDRVNDRTPTVTDLDQVREGLEAQPVSQGYVNKVVRSLDSLRSTVVSRRPPQVLFERSFR